MSQNVSLSIFNVNPFFIIISLVPAYVLELLNIVR